MIAYILEHDLPTSWASALHYGRFDETDLSMEERVQILHFQITHGLCCCQSMHDEEVSPGISRYIWLVDENYRKPLPAELFKNHEQKNQSNIALRNAGNRAQDLQSADRS
jgi:hypothetical protein